LSLLRGFEKFLLVVATTTAIGCSGNGSAVDYAGTAYPSSRPSFEAAGRRLGYLANRNSDTVSVVDLDAMTLLGSVPVGRDPVDIDGPRHIALDTASGLAYVALSYPFASQSVHALSQGEATQRSGYVQALDLLDLSIKGDLRVDPTASEVAFSPSTGRLAVAHADVFRALSSDAAARRANLVLVESASTIAGGDAQARRLPVCAVPSAIAFNDDGSRLFVACTGEDSLAVIDAGSGEVLSRVPSGASPVNKPYALVTDPARDRLLVSNQVTFAVSVFDLNDTPNLLSTMPVLGVPFFAVLVSDTTLAVPFQGPSGAALFDVVSGELLVQIRYSDEECTNPAEFSVTSDSRLRLVCEGDHYRPGALVEVDPETLAITSSVPLEIYPERLSVLEP
jgi:DNA-binding beta-propeller fold protein YncE